MRGKPRSETETVSFRVTENHSVRRTGGETPPATGHVRWLDSESQPWGKIFLWRAFVRPAAVKRPFRVCWCVNQTGISVIERPEKNFWPTLIKPLGQPSHFFFSPLSHVRTISTLSRALDLVFFPFLNRVLWESRGQAFYGLHRFCNRHEAVKSSFYVPP